MVFAIIFFVLGLIIGSFLNVVVARYNTGRSYGGRSECMVCETTLRPQELIPLLSFIFLRGRCSTCETKISLQYPLVELATGLLFLGLYLKFAGLFFTAPLLFAILVAYYGAAFSLLIVIASYDIRHKIIPDPLALVFGLLSFLGIFIFSAAGLDPHLPMLREIYTPILVALPFAAIWLFSRGSWMGLGDAKLALGMALLLGLSRVLSGVVVAFWSGAVIGLLLLLFSKNHRMKSEVPFAPFLVLGAIVAFLFELRLFPL
ncbi:MAG: prepilin peptidase [Patescibacteria group bacterium]